MPESTDKEDNVRARFANLEAANNTPQDNGLPPVPKISIDRPARTPLPGEPKYGAQGNGKFVGNRLMGSGEMRSSGAALTIGTGLVGSIVVGTGLGWLLDHYVLHSKGTPWGLIAGFLLGVASGFIQLVRVANQLNKD